MRKFTVLVEWRYCQQEKFSYELCTIWPTKKEDEEWNGQNYVSRGGNEGMSFDIFDSLEDAIKGANFNINHITFRGLKWAEKRIVKEFKKGTKQ